MKQLLQLIDVKSLVTGAIITYFFTKRNQDQQTSSEEDQP